MRADALIRACLYEGKTYKTKSHLTYSKDDDEDGNDENGFNAWVSPSGHVTRTLEPHSETIPWEGDEIGTDIHKAVRAGHVRAMVFHDSEDAEGDPIRKEVHVNYLKGHPTAKENAIGFLKDQHRPRYRVQVDAEGEHGFTQGEDSTYHTSLRSAIEWIRSKG